MATLGGSSPSHYPIATIVWSSLLILAEFRFNISFIIDAACQTSFLHAFAVLDELFAALAVMTNASELPSIVTWPSRYRFSCLKGRLRDVIMACGKIPCSISHVSSARF
jgi:hypothetical protein